MSELNRSILIHDEMLANMNCTHTSIVEIVDGFLDTAASCPSSKLVVAHVSRATAILGRAVTADSLRAESHWARATWYTRLENLCRLTHNRIALLQ